MDFLLNKQRTQTAIDAVESLQEVYPRTPAIFYTGCNAAELEAVCRHRNVDFVPSEAIPEARWEAGADILRAAMLGVLRFPHEEIPIVRFGALHAPLFEYCDQRIFAPWDARCIAIRRWLLEAAGESAKDVKEYHLCTFDAYFDSLAESELAFARDVKAATIRQNLKEMRALWGVKDIDVLRSRWERENLGRGLQRAGPPPWSSPPPPDPTPAPPRPSARRSS